MNWAEEQDWFGLEDIAYEIREEFYEFLIDNPQEAIKQGYWITANREPVDIHDMTDEHLDNAIKMIEDGRLHRTWALQYLKSEKNKRNGISRSRNSNLFNTYIWAYDFLFYTF